MTFVWTPELATGNSLIDNQHKQLFAALNSLFDAYRNGRERQEVERTMEFLVGYTVKHFADEEALQLKHNFPDYRVHRQCHIDFRGVAQTLSEAVFRDGPTAECISEVYVTIGEWLFSHIKGEDFRMAAYIQSRTQTA